MSTSGNLPPQAYTREVLIKAYEWLTTQTPNVRERATSADAVVALYLQARRRNPNTGEDTLGKWETPTAASVEAFKADLRNLAEGLRQFEDPAAPPPQQATATVPAASVTSPRPHAPPLRTPAMNSAAAINDWADPDVPSERPSVAPVWPATPLPTPPTRMATREQMERGLAYPPEPLILDSKSQNWVREVQNRMNLSSEADALRAIIAVGYERLRDLLPRA
ncbi:MAG: hypothetical protein AB7N80_00200 [Bdellovibrionales bacterium]